MTNNIGLTSFRKSFQRNLTFIQIKIIKIIKITQKGEEKDTFDVAVDGSFKDVLYLRVHLRLHLSCTCGVLVAALINAQKCTT